MLELYSAILKVTGRKQIVLVLLSIVIAGLAVVPLEFQKQIVNGLTDKSMDRSELTDLCLMIMSAILLSLSLKWILNFRSSTLGEDVIRMLRRRTVALSVKAPSDKEKFSVGTLTTMISAETEEVGKFVGGAVSDPLLQIGTLVSVVVYITSSHPVLGLIALCMIVPQLAIVLITQRRVNDLVAQRVRKMRGSCANLSDSNSQDVVDAAMKDFDEIYEVRTKIFAWKLSTKFLLSTLNGTGTVAVLLLGGVNVLHGNTDVGTIVAALAGLSRLHGPTGFLIAFYRQASANTVKFELLRDAGINKVRSA